MGRKAEVCHLTQELERKYVTTGVLEWWIWHFYFKSKIKCCLSTFLFQSSVKHGAGSVQPVELEKSIIIFLIQHAFLSGKC